MKKEEIELIVLRACSDDQDAIHIKLYKEGTICRYGAGGLPQIGISGMSDFESSQYFDKLISEIPDDTFIEPRSFEEEIKDNGNGYLEYTIACFGDSTNSIKGEGAEWSKSSGIRIKINYDSDRANSPMVKMLDFFVVKATEITNEWYFDIIMQAVQNAKSLALPQKTIITKPKTKEEVFKNYENYVKQMINNNRGWNLADYGKDKLYELKDGYKCKIKIKQDDDFEVKFIVVEAPKNIEEASEKEKKKWWQIF